MQYKPGNPYVSHQLAPNRDARNEQIIKSQPLCTYVISHIPIPSHLIFHDIPYRYTRSIPEVEVYRTCMLAYLYDRVDFQLQAGR